MIRRHLVALRLALALADGLSASALFLALAALRFGTGGWEQIAASLRMDVPTAAAVYGAGWVGILAWRKLYNLRSRWTWRAEVRDIFEATTFMAAATLIALFAIKGDISRLFLAALFLSQAVLTTFLRHGLRSIFAYYRARGRNLRYMLVVGSGSEAQEFADRVESFPGLGLVVLGHLRGPDDDDGGTLRRGVLGTVDDIEQILHTRIVDEIALCLSVPDPSITAKVGRLCADEGKTLRVPLEVYGASQEGQIEEFDGLYMYSVTFGPSRVISLACKQMLDMVLAAIAFVLLLPVLVLIAVRIRIADGGPVLFRQTRVGLHGREFTLYKFRTMVPDAEQRLKELQHLNEREGPAFKIASDPRITPTGRFLRATSLDELPQLVNVLRGDMSLVGPRPPLPHEVIRYDAWHRRRLSMKPGITGLWQVEARSNPSWETWVERDLSYIDRWSLWLDLKIMARTIPTLVSRAGR